MKKLFSVPALIAVSVLVAGCSFTGGDAKALEDAGPALDRAVNGIHAPMVAELPKLAPASRIVGENVSVDEAVTTITTSVSCSVLQTLRDEGRWPTQTEWAQIIGSAVSDAGMTLAKASDGEEMVARIGQELLTNSVSSDGNIYVNTVQDEIDNLGC